MHWQINNTMNCVSEVQYGEIILRHMNFLESVVSPITNRYDSLLEDREGVVIVLVL